MAVARCTLSDFSELFRWLLLAACLMAAPPVRADRWSEGRFPIAVFDGYTSHFGMRRGAVRSLRLHNAPDIVSPSGPSCSELVAQNDNHNLRSTPAALVW